MPRKVFVAGDPLTAAQVNTNLMDQSVMRFASAAARDASIPSPTEGMNCYLDDQNWLMVYTGSAWTITGGDKPYFYGTTTFSVPNNSSTICVLTVGVNRGSFQTTGTPGVYLIPQTGIYSITAYANFTTNSTGFRQLYIDVNGGLSPGSVSTTQSASFQTNLSVPITVLLTAGNYFAARVFQNSGSTLSTSVMLTATYLGA
jgi:hypothetical protein